MGENDSSVAYSSLERFSNASYLLPKLTPEDSEGGATANDRAPAHRLISDLSEASECLRSAYDRHQISRTNLISALMDLRDPVLTALANRCLNLTIPTPRSGASSVREAPRGSRRRNISSTILVDTPAAYTIKPDWYNHQRRPTSIQPQPPPQHVRPLREYNNEPANISAPPDFPILDAEPLRTSINRSPGSAEVRVITEPALPKRMSPQPISPPACRNRNQRAKTPPPDCRERRVTPLSVECMSPPPPNQLSWFALPRGATRALRLEDSSPSLASLNRYPRKPQANVSDGNGERLEPTPAPLQTSQAAKVKPATLPTPIESGPEHRPTTQSTEPTEAHVESRSWETTPTAPPLTPLPPQPLPPKPGGARLREPQTLGEDLNAFACDGPSRPNHLEYQKAPTSQQAPIVLRRTESSHHEVKIFKPKDLTCALIAKSPAAARPPDTAHSEASSSMNTPGRTRRRDTVMIKHHGQESPQLVRLPSPKHPPPVVPVKSAPLLSGELFMANDTAGVTSIIQRFESSAPRPSLPPAGKMGSSQLDQRKSFREKLDAFRAMERQLSNDSFAVARSANSARTPVRKQNTEQLSNSPQRSLHESTTVASGLRRSSGSLTARGAGSPPSRYASALQQISLKLTDAMRACNTFYDAHSAVKDIAKEAGELIRLVDSQGNILCPREAGLESTAEICSEPHLPHRCMLHQCGLDPYARLRLLIAQTSPQALPKIAPPAVSATVSLTDAIRSLLFADRGGGPTSSMGLGYALGSGFHKLCSDAPAEVTTYTLSHVDTLGLLAIMHQQQLLIQSLVKGTVEMGEIVQTTEPNSIADDVSQLLKSLKQKM